MTREEFDAGLRIHLGRDPFRPFAVELADGRVVPIEQKSLVFSDGAAAYGTADDELVVFDCRDVRSIRELVAGEAA